MRAENESKTPGFNTTEDFHSWDYLEMMLCEDFARDARDVCDVRVAITRLVCQIIHYMHYNMPATHISPLPQAQQYNTISMQ